MFQLRNYAPYVISSSFGPIIKFDEFNFDTYRSNMNSVLHETEIELHLLSKRKKSLSYKWY